MAEQRALILVAEDDESVRELIKTRLWTAGYDVLTANDGRQALDAVHTAKPAALVLDINMPGLDGFDVLRSMQKTKSLEKTPVLVLTARSATEDVRAALALGARDYMTKPFDGARLLSRVARLLLTLPPPKPKEVYL